MAIIMENLVFASAYKQLQPSERLFVDGYVADLEEAAAKQHSRISNILEHAPPPAVVDASQGLLQRSLVRAAIVERVQEIAAAQELRVSRLVREQWNIGMSNMADFIEIDEWGNPAAALEKVPYEKMVALQSFKYERRANGSTTLEIKLHAKQPALEWLGKYTGALDPDNPHWRAENATPINQKALPANTPVADLSDLYSREINDARA